MRIFLAMPPMYRGLSGLEPLVRKVVPEPCSSSPEFDALVVQCICCMAAKFIYVDRESTFTQFVVDHRVHRGKSGCVLLTPS